MGNLSIIFYRVVQMRMYPLNDFGSFLQVTYCMHKFCFCWGDNRRKRTAGCVNVWGEDTRDNLHSFQDAIPRGYTATTLAYSIMAFWRKFSNQGSLSLEKYLRIRQVGGSDRDKTEIKETRLPRRGVVRKKKCESWVYRT